MPNRKPKNKFYNKARAAALKLKHKQQQQDELKSMAEKKDRLEKGEERIVEEHDKEDPNADLDLDLTLKSGWSRPKNRLTYGIGFGVSTTTPEPVHEPTHGIGSISDYNYDYDYNYSHFDAKKSSPIQQNQNDGSLMARSFGWLHQEIADNGDDFYVEEPEDPNNYADTGIYDILDFIEPDPFTTTTTDAPGWFPLDLVNPVNIEDYPIPEKSEFNNILAPAIYVTNLNYEVPLTPKLNRTWYQRKDYWFPKNFYNLAYFQDQIDHPTFDYEDKLHKDLVDFYETDLIPLSGVQVKKLGERAFEPQNFEKQHDTNFQPRFVSELSINDQSCLNTHNFYRSHHVSTYSLKWSKTLADEAQVWANYLAEFASPGPNSVREEFRKTKMWPHSDRKGQRKDNSWAPIKRDLNVGEIVDWTWSEQASSCNDTLGRIYNEIFYLDPLDPIKPRKLYEKQKQKPEIEVGHLTQLLWKDNVKVGCARTTVEFPNYYDKIREEFGMISTYFVCMYENGELDDDQKNLLNSESGVPSETGFGGGNIITKMLDNYRVVLD